MFRHFWEIHPQLVQEVAQAKVRITEHVPAWADDHSPVMNPPVHKNRVRRFVPQLKTFEDNLPSPRSILFQQGYPELRGFIEDDQPAGIIGGWDQPAIILWFSPLPRKIGIEVNMVCHPPVEGVVSGSKLTVPVWETLSGFVFYEMRMDKLEQRVVYRFRWIADPASVRPNDPSGERSAREKGSGPRTQIKRPQEASCGC